jgi:NAD-dependent deacetylase
MPNLLVLTGAGISAESGISTFRDNDGLWERHRLEDLATPEAFRRDPVLVHRFYNVRRAQLKMVQPNAAHLALAALEQAWAGRGDFLLVTQNVDDLHERAGSKRLVHMHGEIRKLRCERCGDVVYHEEDAGVGLACAACRVAGRMRPEIVWFGEMPFGMDEIYAAAEAADVFVAIGTSGVVYPAAGLVDATRRNGRRCETIEVNPQPTGNPGFARVIAETAVVGMEKLLGMLQEAGLLRPACAGDDVS